MKKFLIIIATIFLFWACGDPNETGSVIVDGPILESMNKDGKLEFNGAVVNTGDTPVRSVYVVVMLKDKKGKVLEAASTPVLGEDSENNLLFPSERVFFTVSAKSDPRRIVSKEAEVYYEDTSEPPPSS